MLHNYSQKIKAFSLIELLITLAIAAIALSLTVPNLSLFLAENEAMQQYNDFVSALQLGLSNAENNTSQVVLCAINPTTNNTCVNYTTTPATNVWTNGWLLFIDNNGNGMYNAGTDTLIKVQVNAANTVSVIAPSSSVIISTSGIITQGAGNYDFSPINCVVNSKTRVTLNASGQMTVYGVSC